MADDPIAETFTNFGMSSVFYCTSDLSAPWGTEIPPMPGIVVFHLLASGDATIEVEGVTTTLTAGDLVLVPHGTGHTITSAPGAPATPLFDLPRTEVTDLYERLEIHGGGASASLICGAVSFTDHAVARLMASLPPTVLADPEDREWLSAAVAVIAEEAIRPRPGSAVVSARLADVLVVQAVRSWLATAEPERGWVAALRDRHIGRALAAVHANPAHPWTLTELAGTAGMSRSAFASRFSDLLGEPTMAYVTSWRMDLAGRRLREQPSSIARVAERVGYRSEAAFNRAFRRAHGMTPGQWRHRSRDTTPLPLAYVVE